MKMLLFITTFLFITLSTLLYGPMALDDLLPGMKERLLFQSTQWNPLLDERLPRLLILLCSGASLAVSGAVMQALFQNPLASPSILGITCGGTLAATLVFYLNWHHTSPFALPISAFLGALFTLLAVYAIAHRCFSGEMTALILTGIAVSTLLYACQSAISYACRENFTFIQTISEWQAGSSTDRHWTHVHMQMPLTIIGLNICMHYREELNILTLGFEEASHLGVDVQTVRTDLFLAIALLTAGTLSSMGTVGFLGLVLPHLLRTVIGPNHKRLIPLCIIVGGMTLTSLDLLLRVFHIETLSIGNISSLIGALFFFIILKQQLKQQSPWHA